MFKVFSVTDWVTLFKSHNSEVGERETDKEDKQFWRLCWEKTLDKQVSYA